MINAWPFVDGINWATSIDLAQAVQAGKFHERLYHYLSEGQLPLPALRERLGDILSLAEYFLGIYSQRLDLPALAGSADALAIARLAGGGQMLVVITSNPLDAQRLSDEIDRIDSSLFCAKAYEVDVIFSRLFL